MAGDRPPAATFASHTAAAQHSQRGHDGLGGLWEPCEDQAADEGGIVQLPAVRIQMWQQGDVSVMQGNGRDARTSGMHHVESWYP